MGGGKRVVAAALIALMVTSAWADEVPDWMRAAGGAAVGGVVGNQVGNGQGRAVTTAVGAAAGSVIASGCKVSTGTVVGGALGGLLGYQVGGGNGKNAMAGVGAAVGAWLGSDCSPVAMAATPVALPGPPFQFNGLTMTPVSGFPLEAFRGVPPIVTTNDLAAAREVAARLAASAKESYQAGDTETALLKMYWAKRVGLVALSVTSNSLAAVSSIKTSKGAVTVSVPAKTLVILPAFDQEGLPGQKMASRGGDDYRVGALDLKNGFQVADNGASGLFNSLGSLTKMLGGGGNAVAPVATGVDQGGGARTLPAELTGMREGETLQMPNGVYVLKTLGNLTAFNPGDQAATLPLDKMDYMPRTPVPSAAREAAAPLMLAINENVTNWAFGTYKPRAMTFWVTFQAPNRVIDRVRGGEAVAYVDSLGSVTPLRMDGEQAYKADKNYRLASTLMDAIGRAPAVVGFLQQCRTETLGHFTELSGQYANTLKGVCFKGSYNNGSVGQVSARTFLIGDDGAAVQTLESLAADKRVIATMEKALLYGKTTSDALAATGTPVGNIESALQCFDKDTMGQMAVVTGFQMNGKFEGNTVRGTAALGTGYAAARLAGWNPKPAEWELDRVVNCVGAIPLAGTAIQAGKKVAGMVGKDVLAAVPNLAQLQKMFEVFDTPATFNRYVKGIKSAEDLYPGNSTAAGFIKTMYDGLMTGQSITELKGDFAELRAL